MGIKVSCLILLLAAGAVSGFAQTGQPASEPADDRRNVSREEPPRSYERPGANRPPNAAAARNRIANQRNYFPLKPKRNKEQQKRLAPTAEELSRHAAFLGQPKTGVVRLMPDVGCAPTTNVVRADEACLNYIPGSSFYSFREREYSLEALSDVRYKNGLLLSDGIFSQGILVNLGDVAAEKLTLDSDGVRFLTEYEPATIDTEVVRQYQEAAQGIRSGKYIYRKSLPVRENATYALRVIAYPGRFVRVFRGYRFDLLAGDARRDVLIVFRVARKDEDGGILLLWKELARKKAPKLTYSKKESKK